MARSQKQTSKIERIARAVRTNPLLYKCMKSWRSERVRQEEPRGQHRQRGDKWGGARWMPKWFPWHSVCQQSGGKCAQNRCFPGTEKWNINESIGNTWIAEKKRKKKVCLGGGKLNKNCSCAEFPSAQTLMEAAIPREHRDSVQGFVLN